MNHKCPKCAALSFIVEEKIQYCEKCNYMQGENEEKTCHNACDFPDCTLKYCGMKIKQKHGGRREGAGRKPIYTEQTQTISFRVPKSLIEPITKYVKRALAKSKK